MRAEGKNKKQWQVYLPSVIVAVGIAYCSLATITVSLPKPLIFPHFDKIIHSLMYLSLGATLIYANHKNKVKIKSNLLVSTLLSAVYGGIMELLQNYFFTSRTGEWLDFAADVLGALAAAVIYYAVFFTKNR